MFFHQMSGEFEANSLNCVKSSDANEQDDERCDYVTGRGGGGEKTSVEKREDSENCRHLAKS